jgi:chromosome segregation ATPase
MGSDDATPLPNVPMGEVHATALAEEVRQLKALLAELLAELGPGIQSSLRERSAELQRLGGELAEREATAERLQRELGEARAQAEDLEREVERWRGAATRGLDEIAERARQQAERFERQEAELNRALVQLRAELEASRARAETAAAARDGAMKDLERRNRRVGALKAKVLRREANRIRMTQSLSWRMTAPLRWIPETMHRLLLGGARLRRRLMGR